jgi:large subunit ribosomal protein L39e
MGMTARVARLAFRWTDLQLVSRCCRCALQPSHKTFKIKKILGKKQRQNRPIPQWVRLRTGNTIRCVLPFSRVVTWQLAPASARF